MSLAKEKINDLWCSGYCAATIRFAQTTSDSAEGARQRITQLQRHIVNEHCEDCEFANKLKALESVVAQRMGPRAYALFLHGGDVMQHPELAERGQKYEDCLREVLDGAIAAGAIPVRMRDWMATVARRKDFEKEAPPHE
jgi:hypothetical protein